MLVEFRPDTARYTLLHKQRCGTRKRSGERPGS